MAVQIERIFHIEAPVEQVWGLLIDPQRVVRCMPGASLEGITDDSHFTGNIRVKAGPIVVSYKGQAEFKRLDEVNHVVEVLGQGREAGGAGRAKGSMASSLTAADGGTEVSLKASVDVTGRVMQLGARMMESVAQRLLEDFISCARATLEAASAEDAVAPHDAAPTAEAKPIPVISLVVSTMGQTIGSFFKRLLRRGT